MKKYSIVGQKPRGFDPYLPGMSVGTPVILVREPNNPHDPNAVMVWIDGIHVGYIPKNQNNAALAHHIDWTGRDHTQFIAELIAMDSVRHVITTETKEVVRKAIDGKLVRSPNSAYPQVEIEDF